MGHYEPGSFRRRKPWAWCCGWPSPNACSWAGVHHRCTALKSRKKLSPFFLHSTVDYSYMPNSSLENSLARKTLHRFSTKTSKFLKYVDLIACSSRVSSLRQTILAVGGCLFELEITTRGGSKRWNNNLKIQIFACRMVSSWYLSGGCVVSQDRGIIRQCFISVFVRHHPWPEREPKHPPRLSRPPRRGDPEGAPGLGRDRVRVVVPVLRGRVLEHRQAVEARSQFTSRLRKYLSKIGGFFLFFRAFPHLPLNQ